MKLVQWMCVGMLVAGMAMAQEKVGYIDMNELFESYYKTVNANIGFEQKKHEVDDKLSVLRKGMEELFRELKKLEEEARNDLLAQNVREEAANKLKTRAEIFEQKRSEFDRERQNSLQQLRRIQMEAESTLVAELRKAVRNHATANGYTHVVDISGQTMNRIPVFLVYPEKQSITAQLIAEVNKGHEQELTEAKAKLEKIKAGK